MRMISQSPEHVRIRIENTDDVWILSQVVMIGDRVTSKTTRKIKKEGTDTKAQVTKRTITVTLTVAKTQWTSQSLRITGAVCEGPEDVPQGSSHTITAEPGSELTIRKETWPTYQRKQLQESSDRIKHTIIICVFGRDEATFAQLTPYGYTILGEIKGDVAKKRMTESIRRSFYTDLGKQIETYNERISPTHIILASPSFWNEELMKEWNPKELNSKIILATCSSSDRRAIDEVLKRPETKEALQRERVREEATLVEQVQSRIATDGAVAYGVDHVRDAVEAGAVDHIIITDTHLNSARENNTINLVETLMKRVDQRKGTVHVISSAHAAGQQLDGLGGIAALLRYKLH